MTRLLAGVLAAAVVGAAFVVGVEAAAGLLDRGAVWVPRDRWDRWLSARRWEDGMVMAVAAAIAATGVVLAAVGLWPRRERWMPITPDDVSPGPRASLGDRRVLVGRRGVEARVADVVRRESGVIEAESRLGRRRLTITVTVPAVGPPDDEVRPEVASAAREALLRAAPGAHHDVRTRIRRSRERVL